MLNINDYFNGFQVRIIGSNELPMFYAPDIAEVLGIEKIRNTLGSFGPDDLISPDVRKKYGVNTYRADGKKDNRIHLLTLQGVIRLINISRKVYANDFRKFIADLVDRVRLDQQSETGIELGLLDINDTQNRDGQRLRELRKVKESESGNLCNDDQRFNQSLAVKTNLRPLYIFEVKCDPTQNQQCLDEDVSSDDDSDIEDQDNIIYIKKQIKKQPYDDTWPIKLEENKIDSPTDMNTTKAINNRSCYLITTDNHYSKLYLKHTLDTTLYSTNPESTIKYLRKQWSPFVGSSQRYKDKLLLTMEKDYFIKDLKKVLTTSV